MSISDLQNITLVSGNTSSIKSKCKKGSIFETKNKQNSISGEQDNKSLENVKKNKSFESILKSSNKKNLEVSSYKNKEKTSLSNSDKNYKLKLEKRQSDVAVEDSNLSADSILDIDDIKENLTLGTEKVISKLDQFIEKLKDSLSKLEDSSDELKQTNETLMLIGQLFSGIDLKEIAEKVFVEGITDKALDEDCGKFLKISKEIIDSLVNGDSLNLSQELSIKDLSQLNSNKKDSFFKIDAENLSSEESLLDYDNIKDLKGISQLKDLVTLIKNIQNLTEKLQEKGLSKNQLQALKGEISEGISTLIGNINEFKNSIEKKSKVDFTDKSNRISGQEVKSSVDSIRLNNSDIAKQNSASEDSKNPLNRENTTTQQKTKTFEDNIIKNQSEASSGNNKEDLVLKKIIGNETSKIDDLSGFASRLKDLSQIKEVKNQETPVINKYTMNQDVVKSIKYMNTNSMRELTVKVNPVELGEITIKLVAQGESMKATIHASSKETYNLLNSGELKNLLNNQNIKVSEINIALYNDDTTFFKDGEFNKDGSMLGEQNNSRNGKENDSNRNLHGSQDEFSDEYEEKDLNNFMNLNTTV